MSGIAGILRLDGAPAQPAQMQAMLAAMARRGPDRQDSWCDAGVAMGQVLLATTPEALAERQPWRHPADGCVVVSDSRLDDRQELLRELGITDAADAVGDARLLHAAWRRWGEDCPLHLLGDFAFAIWDPVRRTLFCARDTAGVRPLYFHHAPGKLLAFASDIQALLALPEVPARLDEIRLVEGLLPQLQALDDTGTIYRHIRRCPPAHTLLLEDGRLLAREYWNAVSVEPVSLPCSEQDWQEGLRHHFEEAVRCRLRGLGRLGSMLSGGLDSSSVVAVACRQLAEAGREPLLGFSAVSSDPGCPETAAIRRMIDAFPVQANCFDAQAASTMLDAIVREWPGMAHPADGMMAMVDCQYRTAAAQGCRVVFDGNNADALLFEGHYLSDLLRHGRWLAAMAEARGQEAFYREGWGSWGYLKPALIEAFLPARLRSLIRRYRQPGLIRGHLREALVAPGFVARSGLAETLQALAGRASRPQAARPDGLAQSWLMSSHTIAGMERYGRLAAAQGVETRHPFMDRRLVEFCAWIPVRLRLRDGWPKWLLRRAMAAGLPAEIAWRRGKEHLGGRFNRIQFDRASDFHPQLATRRPDVLGLLDPDRMPLVGPGAGTEGQAGGAPWESRLVAAMLMAWLSGTTQRGP
jgi:asparagine synthase (glutamine-hydrolysing)